MTLVTDPVVTVEATTTTTTTTTTSTPAPAPVVQPVLPYAVHAPVPPPVLSPQAAVQTLLRYDPYIAPKYRSGRNLVTGGALALSFGSLTALGTLFWSAQARTRVAQAPSEVDRQRLADRYQHQLPTARIVGAVAGGTAALGVVLLAIGILRRRRAIEEARGRVYMQSGPGGLQVRF